MKINFHILALLVFVGCNSSEKTPNQNEENSNAVSVSETETDLHDIWALDWMAGVNMDSATFMAGVPTLELYPKDSNVIGHTGCNNLNGKLILSSHNGLRFDKLATTKKFCIGNTEAVFLDNLTKTTRYAREDLMLVFLQDDMAVMRFKKVD